MSVYISRLDSLFKIFLICLPCFLFYRFIRIPHKFWTWIICCLYVLRYLHLVCGLLFHALDSIFYWMKISNQISGIVPFLIVLVPSLIYTFVCTNTEKNFKIVSFYYMNLSWEFNLSAIKNNSFLPYGLKRDIPSFNILFFMW